MCFVYFLSFLDKQTLNYANAYGLQADLGLKGTDYSWVASVTNIGYLVSAYPSNVALQKFPIGKFVACALMLWGVLLMCTTAVKNFAGLMTIRFLLGAAEACIGPAWMLLTSMFWTREEQPFRMCGCLIVFMRFNPTTTDIIQKYMAQMCSPQNHGVRTDQ